MWLIPLNVTGRNRADIQPIDARVQHQRFEQQRVIADDRYRQRRADRVDDQFLINLYDSNKRKHELGVGQWLVK